MRSSICSLSLSAVRSFRPVSAPLSAAAKRSVFKPAKGAAAVVDPTTKVLRVREYEYIETEDEERDWDFSDISSLAHGELEQHREARHYARVAAYEMPRLAQLAKAFVPPTKATPLRFRYTTYMGEQHPAESKVVLEFAPIDLELTAVERSKLIKLAGPRYNPSKKIIKMSCEMFDHQAQNKRYLSDLVDKLLIEARDPTDTFEDVPFDFRHHKTKPKMPGYPRKWIEQYKAKHPEEFPEISRAAAALEEAIIPN